MLKEKTGEQVIEGIRAEGPGRKKDMKLMAADMFADGAETFNFGSGVKTYSEEGDGLLTM